VIFRLQLPQPRRAANIRALYRGQQYRAPQHTACLIHGPALLCVSPRGAYLNAHVTLQQADRI
jgi:hypothetical protein